MRIYTLLVTGALWALTAGAASAQTPALPAVAAAQTPAPAAPAGPTPEAPAAAAPSGPTITLCNGAYSIGPPATNPPAGSGPVVYQVVLCFEKQGNVSLIEPQTYLYYIQGQNRVSLPSRNE